MGYLRTQADSMYTDWGLAAAQLYIARNQLYYAGDYIEAEAFDWAKTALYAAADAFGLATGYLHGGTDVSGYIRNCMYWIDDNLVDGAGEYELTMSKILDALWAAEPYQCLLFIPMIDAMRGAIQEKTVTSQYMADALRHFV